MRTGQTGRTDGQRAILCGRTLCLARNPTDRALACSTALQVAAQSEPDHAGRVRREQYILLALAMLSALASCAVNLVGARRLCHAVVATTRRISNSVARLSAGGGSPEVRRNSRGARVAPGRCHASAPLDGAPKMLSGARRSAHDAPWPRALDGAESVLGVAGRPNIHS